MQRSIAVLLLLVALAHAVPTIAFLDASLLTTFYGVRDIDADLEALLRHRALLFGIVAGILALGALRPTCRLLALTVGWLSVGAFIYLAMAIPGTNALVDRVMYIDLGLAMALAIATGLSIIGSSRRTTSPGNPARYRREAALAPRPQPVSCRRVRANDPVE